MTVLAGWGAHGTSERGPESESIAGVALTTERKEATAGFASWPLGFPSGCFRDPERSEANPRTTVRKISGGDGRICPFASLRGATRPALDPGKALPLRSLVDGRDPAARNGSQGTDEWGFCRTRPWRPAGPLLAFGRIPCKGRGFQRCLAGRDP